MYLDYYTSMEVINMVEIEIKEKREELPNFVFAGFLSRFIAYILDIIVINSLSKLVRNILSIFLTIENTGKFFSPYNLIALGIYLAYFTLMTMYNDGQTLGKMVLGLRVVSLTGEKLDKERVIMREVFGRFILYRIKILYLTTLFTEKNQHLGDAISDSGVVKESYLEKYEELIAIKVE